MEHHVRLRVLEAGEELPEGLEPLDITTGTEQSHTAVQDDGSKDTKKGTKSQGTKSQGTKSKSAKSN